MLAGAGWFGDIAEGLPTHVQQATAVALLFALAGLGICAIIWALSSRTRGVDNAPVRGHHERAEGANVGVGMWAHTGERNHNIDGHGADR